MVVQSDDGCMDGRSVSRVHATKEVRALCTPDRPAANLALSIVVQRTDLSPLALDGPNPIQINSRE